MVPQHVSNTPPCSSWIISILFISARPWCRTRSGALWGRASWTDLPLHAYYKRELAESTLETTSPLQKSGCTRSEYYPPPKKRKKRAIQSLGGAAINTDNKRCWDDSNIEWWPIQTEPNAQFQIVINQKHAKILCSSFKNIYFLEPSCLMLSKLNCTGCEDVNFAPMNMKATFKYSHNHKFLRKIRDQKQGKRRTQKKWDKTKAKMDVLLSLKHQPQIERRRGIPGMIKHSGEQRSRFGVQSSPLAGINKDLLRVRSSSHK